MIIFLHGPDSYRRNLKLKEVVGSYRKKYRDADIQMFDFSAEGGSASGGDEPDDWIKAKDFLAQPSMFTASKVAVLKEGTSVDEKKWIETLKSYLKSGKIFVILSDSKKPAAKLSFLLKPPVKCQEFGELAGVKLTAFLKKEATVRNLRFSALAWQDFVSYIASVKNRSQIAINELEKIKLAGFGQPVGVDELGLVIPERSTEEMFRVVWRFLNAKEPVKKLAFLEELMARDESPDHVFNFLASLAKGKTAEDFADYDVMRKSGKIEIEEALLSWALGR